jgi:hypothetical protein
MNIGSDKWVSEGGIVVDEVVKPFIIGCPGKEVHCPDGVVLGRIFEGGGLVGKGKEVPVALRESTWQHHAVGWMCIVDGVEVVGIRGSGRDDAGGEEEVERRMKEKLALLHDCKG